jgi:hypothetical protein
MNISKDRNTVIARLILNTKRLKRINSLVEIAQDIRWLEKDMGSLKAVAEVLKLTTEMLGRFLSVERLCPEVRKIVQERKIDLINVVHYMRIFSPREQKVIANVVTSGDLSGEDIRVLAPLHRSQPNLSIEQLISHVRKAKNIRMYVAYLPVPDNFKNAGVIKGRLTKIVGETGIASFNIKGKVITMMFSADGHKKIREAAKGKNLSLGQYLKSLILTP